MISVLEADLPIRAGRRNILEDPALKSIIRSDPVTRLVTGCLSERANCVRGILFDKSPESNWNLPFHQDTKIAVRERYEVPVFSQFSEKYGVLHVCPPLDVLSRQIAVRIHLDPCPLASGPVRVIPGSDRDGILDQTKIQEWIQTESPVACTGGLGSILVFRSLLLHGSDRSLSTLRRRVLHLEFCDAPLPPPLEWKWAIPII